MTSVFANVLSAEEVQYLNNLPEVLTAKASLDLKPSGLVYFSVAVTETIRAALESRFGLHISAGSSIPMRWIKGDTVPHVDSGASAFENTYLVYLNDSPGELVIDSQSYHIQANTGFVFNEGLSHETQGTEGIARLLLGPMNEFAEPVGITVVYYPTQADALAFTNAYGTGSSFIVGDGGPFGGYTSWRLASNSAGTSPQNVVYVNGDTLIEDGSYYLYPSNPCFLEGSTILCEVDGVEKYVPVEELKVGTLVKTSLDGYKAVVLIGNGSILNPGNDERIENRLYKCATSKYPELKQDLYITGCHSILVNELTDAERVETAKQLGKIFVTDKKYRLTAFVDSRAIPWNSEGAYTIWHFALENENEKMNYGVYANGLLVETCSIKTLKEKSNMALSVVPISIQH
jgi:hypothetical protein